MNSIREIWRFGRDNLDSLLALASAVFAFFLIVFLQTRMGNPAYTITAVLVFLACVVYLVLKKRQKLLAIPATLSFEANTSAVLLADIVFFALFAGNLWAFAFRPEPYVRPLECFILMAAMSAVLAVKILFLPSKGSKVSFTLFQNSSEAPHHAGTRSGTS